MPHDESQAPEETKYSIFERVLAYTSVAIMVVAVAAYLATLIVAMVAGPAALVDGLWPLVTAISYIGLPIGFVLLVILLGINFSRRGRGR